MKRDKQRGRNTRYKKPQLVAQECFVASLDRCFAFLTLRDQLVAQQCFVATLDRCFAFLTLGDQLVAQQ